MCLLYHIWVNCLRTGSSFEVTPLHHNTHAPGLLASLSRHGFLLCPLFHVLLLFVPLGSPFIKKPATSNRALRARLAGRVAFFFPLPSHLLSPLRTDQFGGFVMEFGYFIQFHIIKRLFYCQCIFLCAFFTNP